MKTIKDIYPIDTPLGIFPVVYYWMFFLDTNEHDISLICLN